MNKWFLVILYLCFCQIFIAQQKDKSEILYDKGNAAVTKKNYRAADSLFTLSLNLVPHPDSYFNRAVCRRQLKDFKGYCVDLNSAAKFGDKEAKGLFWKQCAKADTFYKKNNGNSALETDFDLVEYVTTYNYNTDFQYRKYDTSGICILAKARHDNTIMYLDSKEVIASKYNGGLDSLINYIKTRTEFLKNVRQKGLAGFTYLSLVTDENGKVKEVKDHSYGNEDEEKDLIDALSGTPDWTPAVYNGRNVKFKHNFFVRYYGDVLKMESILSQNRNPNETFTVVEEMPMFPGGPMEMMKFIQKTIVYPQMAKEAGLMGKCFLKFVVNADGALADIEIIKGVPKCPACDKEAIRVVQSMPVWKPGRQNGKAVSCFFNLPINFQLR